MNRAKIESNIAYAYHMSDKKTITEIMNDLLANRIKLDRWFDKYLDMFDERMNSSKHTDPVWKLYNQKCEVYSDIEKAIKTAQYFMRKFNV